MRPLNSHRARAVFGFFRRRLIAQKTKSSRAVTRVVTTWRQAIQAGYRFIVLPVISTVNSRTPPGRRYESTKNQSQVIENNVVSRRHLVGIGNKRTASMTPT